eukprot:scaffold3472_cov68-Cylindrotheca_fusiformis.AAC.2
MDPEGDPRTTPVYQWLHPSSLLDSTFHQVCEGSSCLALDQYYSQVGYPLVFQTDNGGHRGKIPSPSDYVLAGSWSTCPKRTWLEAACYTSFLLAPGGGESRGRWPRHCFSEIHVIPPHIVHEFF